jgi:hypothetical protein
MSIIDRENQTSRSTSSSKTLIGSIGRGLDKILSSPTPRVREMRRELESQETDHRHRVEARSLEYRETLEMAAKYLRSLPSS